MGILHSANKEINMLSKVVPMICLSFVFVHAKVPTTDEACFNQRKPSTFEAAPNSTFEVRIEHEGDIVTDWFTNGDLYTLKMNEAMKVNASTLSVHNVCVYYNTELGDTTLCKDSVDGSALNDLRDLWLFYNGKTVCGGMLKKDINITDVNADKIPDPVPTVCNYICMNASLFCLHKTCLIFFSLRSWTRKLFFLRLIFMNINPFKVSFSFTISPMPHLDYFKILKMNIHDLFKVFV